MIICVSKLLSDFLEVAKLDRVESSRTFSHCDTVPRNSVSHVIIIDVVAERSSLDVIVVVPAAIGHFAVDCGFDVVVFEEMRSDLVYS